MKQKIAALLLPLLLLCLLALPARGTDTLVTSDDTTGGDCTLIGDWDWPTKTYTLTMDLTPTIAESLTVAEVAAFLFIVFATHRYCTGRKYGVQVCIISLIFLFLVMVLD